jgi:hypothetical protein
VRYVRSHRSTDLVGAVTLHTHVVALMINDVQVRFPRSQNINCMSLQYICPILAQVWNLRYRSWALAFATSHEQPFTLPHCGISNISRVAIVVMPQ